MAPHLRLDSSPRGTFRISGRPASRDRRTRWDIVDEHLDEAAFLLQLWEDALRSPEYTLDEIARGPEARMLANVDGLVVGGPAVARRVLVPALGRQEPGVAFAAALALLDGGVPEHIEAVLTALARSSSKHRRALRRALAVAPHPDLGAAVAARVPRAGEIQDDLLEVVAYRGIDPGVRLEPLAASPDPAQEALALRLARLLPGKLDPAAIERGLTSPEPEVRAASIESGMVLGIRRAFPAAVSTVKEGGPGFAAAALVLGLSGDEQSVATLSSALADETVAQEAMFALGFTGRVSAADKLVDAMQGGALAPLAAEAFSGITGLAVERGFAKRPPAPGQAADRGEGGVNGPETELPRPDPGAVARWWSGARRTLDPARRWFRGRPWSAHAVLWELERGPAKRRCALSLDLSIRTRGQLWIASDGLSEHQRWQIAEARGSAAYCSSMLYRSY